MKEQLQRGHLKYISFVLLDLLCLTLANYLAVKVYLIAGKHALRVDEYISVVVYMIVIDVIVIVMFNSLKNVLRRGRRRELIEGAKHTGINILILALLLFSSKQGEEFSRVTVYLAYFFYYILIVAARVLWKTVLRKEQQNKPTPTVLLITTSGYAIEGLRVVENAGMTVKGIFTTDKTNEGLIRNIPTIVERGDAIAFVCWEWIDKVYICGPDNLDLPGSLLKACKQMGVPIYTAPVRKSLEYEIIKIRTALQKNDISTGLSFFEGEHDVPFMIRSVYTIFENEQDKQTGFHAHKQSWHFLFCPYGNIDVIIDTGKERKTITLSDPSTGLILHPSVWREILWRKPGSVLCVAASGHYDQDRLRKDYNEYLRFLQEREWSATVESAEIMGEVII